MPNWNNLETRATGTASGIWSTTITVRDSKHRHGYLDQPEHVALGRTTINCPAGPHRKLMSGYHRHDQYSGRR